MSKALHVEWTMTCRTPRHLCVQGIGCTRALLRGRNSMDVPEYCPSIGPNMGMPRALAWGAPLTTPLSKVDFLSQNDLNDTLLEEVVPPANHFLGGVVPPTTHFWRSAWHHLSHTLSLSLFLTHTHTNINLACSCAALLAVGRNSNDALLEGVVPPTNHVWRG